MCWGHFSYHQTTINGKREIFIAKIGTDYVRCAKKLGNVGEQLFNFFPSTVEENSCEFSVFINTRLTWNRASLWCARLTIVQFDLYLCIVSSYTIFNTKNYIHMFVFLIVVKIYLYTWTFTYLYRCLFIYFFNKNYLNIFRAVFMNI